LIHLYFFLFKRAQTQSKKSTKNHTTMVKKTNIKELILEKKTYRISQADKPWLEHLLVPVPYSFCTVPSALMMMNALPFVTVSSDLNVVLCLLRVVKNK